MQLELAIEEADVTQEFLLLTKRVPKTTAIHHITSHHIISSNYNWNVHWKGAYVSGLNMLGLSSASASAREQMAWKRSCEVDCP